MLGGGGGSMTFHLHGGGGAWFSTASISVTAIFLVNM